jgi:hypothetical protein
MKKSKTLILVVVAVLFCVVAVAIIFIAGEQRRNWPSVQMQSAIAIMKVVAQYRDDHGSYPNSLEVLVSSGQISEDQYHKLMFQDRRHGNRKAWIYHPPTTASSVAIVSPNPVIPWSGSGGVFITARADGGGELIATGKIHDIAFRLDKETEQAVDGKPPEPPQPPR